MNQHFPDIDPLDWNTVQPLVDALLAFDLTEDTVRAWLQEWSDLESVWEESRLQVYREVTENTADADADARFRHHTENIEPEVMKAKQALKQKLLDAEFYIPTPETALILQRFRTEAELYREENVPLTTELTLLGKQYDEIRGGMSIEWEGERKTIPQAALLLEERDRTVRERAWRLILDCYLQERESLAALFLKMLHLRRKMAANAGFADFRSYQWQVMARFDYTPADCRTFRDAIENEVVPLATELYKDKAAQLELAAIRPWETTAPWEVAVDPYDEPLRPFQDVKDLEDTCHHIFSLVDPTLGDYFGEMRNHYLDLETRPNKAPGGYCESFPVSGQPYIFMNAAGSAINVITLLHEGGHAFHFDESYRSQSLVWNYNGPLEFCEVASMSMELLSMPYWRRDKGGFYDEQDYRRAAADQLTTIVLFFPYMALVDAFQHWLYVEAPEDITATDLDRKWSELWDRFMPGIDYTGLQTEKETGWQRLLHIYQVPFYYIEYGLAQLGALQVWRNALQNRAEAVADYRQALALGYTRPLPELFKAAGAEFAFDRKTVGELMALVREQLALIAT